MMRKLHVRHEPLPHIGEKFELDTASGLTISVVTHRSGRRDLGIGERGGYQPLVTAVLTRPEAAAVAALLVGAHIELVTTPDS
jgi:K+/H+ antiporter YhaU regulatory subunit KhtT